MLILSQPELRRVLWPLFVYSFFNMVTSFYPQDAKSFFETNKNMFLPEHTDDVRQNIFRTTPLLSFTETTNTALY